MRMSGPSLFAPAPARRSRRGGHRRPGPGESQGADIGQGACPRPWLGRPGRTGSSRRSGRSDELPARPAEQVGVLVSRLRSVLGSDRLRRLDGGWALDLDWFDVAELEARVDEAAARMAAANPVAAPRPRPGPRSRSYEARCWPTSPTRSGPRSSCAAAARTVARARLIGAEAALAAGDRGDAAALAEGALDHDPYDEAALRVLMRSYAAAGRPASALAAYARVRGRLSEDLGVDPGRETEELHTAILLDDTAAMDPDPLPMASDLHGGSRGPGSPTGRARPSADPGPGGRIGVGGGRGRGRHRQDRPRIPLVEPAARRKPWWSPVAATNWDVICLSNRSSTGWRRTCAPSSHQPWRASWPTPSRSSARCSGDSVTGSAQPGPTTVVDPVAGRALLFAALLTTIERAAGDRASVVIVEDVHLAGETTIEWLRFAVRRGTRLLVVATRRPEGPTLGTGGDPAPRTPRPRLGGRPVRSTAGTRAARQKRRSSALPPRAGQCHLGRIADQPAPGRLPRAWTVMGEAAPTLRAAAILGTEVDVDLLAGVLHLPVATLARASRCRVALAHCRGARRRRSPFGTSWSARPWWRTPPRRAVRSPTERRRGCCTVALVTIRWRWHGTLASAVTWPPPWWHWWMRRRRPATASTCTWPRNC